MTPKGQMMQANNNLGMWDQVAVAMAVITVGAAAIVILAYGRGSDGFNYITNWPLVVGAAASAVWACLFAALMVNVRHNRNALDALLADHMAKKEIEETEKAEQAARDAAMKAVLADI